MLTNYFLITTVLIFIGLRILWRCLPYRYSIKAVRNKITPIILALLQRRDFLSTVRNLLLPVARCPNLSATPSRKTMGLNYPTSIHAGINTTVWGKKWMSVSSWLGEKLGPQVFIYIEWWRENCFLSLFRKLPNCMNDYNDTRFATQTNSLGGPKQTNLLWTILRWILECIQLFIFLAIDPTIFPSTLARELNTPCQVSCFSFFGKSITIGTVARKHRVRLSPCMVESWSRC